MVKCRDCGIDMINFNNNLIIMITFKESTLTIVPLDNHGQETNVWDVILSIASFMGIFHITKGLSTHIGNLYEIHNFCSLFDLIFE